MIAISNSEIATWDRCRRQWFLKYFLGETPADEPPVSNQLLGTRVHAALEGKYGYELDPVTVLETLYKLTIEAFPDWRTELLAERELAVTMVSGYLEWIEETGKDAGLTVVATERDIEVPFPRVPGVALKARLDQVVYSETTGLLSFLDHKTAANFDQHEMLALNPQFKTYSVVQRLAVAQAAPAHVHDGQGTVEGCPGCFYDPPRVSGGMINTLRRVKRTEKSKPPYYQRDEFRYNDEELDSAELRIEAVCQEIMTARRYLDWAYGAQGGALSTVNDVQRHDLYPSPRGHECRWDCPFITLCPMMDDGSDWPGVLTSSGRYRQDDPYSYYYKNDPLHAVRAKLGLHGEVDARTGVRDGVPGQQHGESYESPQA